MSPEEFVQTIWQVVVESTTLGELESLRQPPGRSPSASLRSRSEWFSSLGPEDHAAVAEVIQSAARNAIFGLFAVLDGVRSFDPAGGSLLLTYVGPGGDEVRLNDPTTCELHAELPLAP